MPYEAYIDVKFTAAVMAVIDQANEIISEYEAEGLTITLRQLYYQFVARDLLPNKQSEYKRLGEIINKGRLAGHIDWEMMEDRTRELVALPHWEKPTDILQGAAEQFRLDIWEDQPYRIEVWVEKEALVGVIERICERYQVPYFACRGNTSQSEAWRAGKRFEQYSINGQRPLVLHLGDHDPSGIDMTRDNQDRMDMFVRDGEFSVEVRRIALNMDQVEKYNPPPNPAKQTDSRFAAYAREYGLSSWELDALDPRVIQQLIEKHIKGALDVGRWNDAIRRQKEGREKLSYVVENFEKLAKPGKSK